jgi:uncharacterized protein (DUF488 family)
MQKLFTIGHSTHAIEFFLNLLRSHDVNCVIDVRSIAASRFNPQYNKKALQHSLMENNILYMHFEKEFGARQTNAAVVNDDGQVDFEKVRQSSEFRNGINRLKDGIQKGYTIALMCAEAEPLDCHRFAMITPALKESGFEVKHILKDNSLTSTEDLETQLLQKFKKKISVIDMYADTREQLRTAYKLLNATMGYKPLQD